MNFIIKSLLISSLFILPILKYFTLNSSIYDMGIFQHLSYVLKDISSTYELFSGHIHFYSIITSFMYSIFHSGYLLIILQCFVTLGSVLLLSQLAPKNHKSIIITVFLLSYAIWYNLLFDFHLDHLSILFMSLFYYHMNKQNYKISFLMGILVLLIKETFALVTSFMGLYMIIKSKQYLKGSILFLVGLGYFYIVTHYVIPFFTIEYKVVGNSDYMMFGNGGSLLDIFLYPIINFKEFIIDIFATKKLIYLLALFSAFGLIVVFFSPIELIPAIPPLAIAMLSNVENYYWYNTHYTAPLIVPFIMAFIYGLPRLINFCKNYVGYLNNERKILVVLFIPILLSHIIFSPSPLSRFFWFDKIPQYYYEVYIPAKRTAIIKEALLRYIPNTDNISVSSQNSLNWGHLAERQYYFSFPQGVITKTNVIYIDSNSYMNIIEHLLKQDKSIVKTKRIQVDFVTLDLKRPLYLMDKNVSKDEFMEVIEKMKNDYEVLYKYDGFYIYQRKRLNEYD